MNPLAIADSGTWSLGVLIGGPIAAIFFLVPIGFAIFCFRERESGIGLCCLAGSLAVAIFCVTPLGFWPFKAEYHQWRDVTGTVAQVDERIISNSDGPSTKFVVQLSEDGQQFACDDSRCAQLDEGDSVALSCKRAWQYTGTDGYDCRFVSSEVTR